MKLARSVRWDRSNFRIIRAECGTTTLTDTTDALVPSWEGRIEEPDKCRHRLHDTRRYAPGLRRSFTC